MKYIAKAGGLQNCFDSRKIRETKEKVDGNRLKPLIDSVSFHLLNSPFVMIFVRLGSTYLS